MIKKENVMKIAPVIMGLGNWGLLAALVAGVEYMPENEVKNYVRAAVYGSFLGASVIGYFGRKKRANAKLYNDRVCVHDPDSGRDIHFEYIARVNIPNLLVNPWAVLSPIMADVVRLSKMTGSLSCTPKTTKWLAATDGVRWNIDKTGSNEWITGLSARHLNAVIEELAGKNDLNQQQQDMKDGVEKMLKNGLKIEK